MQTIFIFMITFDSHTNLEGEGKDNGMISLFIDKENEPQQGTKSPGKWQSHDQIKPSDSRARPLSTTQAPYVLFVPWSLETQQLLFLLWM